MVLGPLKPWYVFRPRRIWDRLVTSRARAVGVRSLKTTWGGVVVADAGKAIGQTISRLGLFDLTVSEAIVRLAGPGSLVVDVGANVGYMTQLSSMAVGQFGRVIAYEPNPTLRNLLIQNAGATFGRGCAPELRFTAVGAERGTVRMRFPRPTDTNDGVGAVVDDHDSAAAEVPCVKLDEELGNLKVAVLKIDVEGYEEQVLRGAQQALEAGRIEHVIFEDHDPLHSGNLEFLKSCGYEVLALGWKLSGLVVRPAEDGPLSQTYEAPNYIATRDVRKTTARLGRWWKCLRPLSSPFN